MDDTFKNYCINQHDVVCNQKYNNTLPYSFHLNLVALQAIKWNFLLKSRSDKIAVVDAAYGHDLIEDARVTYNDIVKIQGNVVADIIYACTDEKGKSRKTRHSAKFF